MILIADAHITQERQEEFFQMLDAISATQEDLLFLGDIFDIWIPFPKYEKEFHRRFVQWCKKEKTRRKVIFLEGNHEFHIQSTHGDAFTAVGTYWTLEDGSVAFHGEKIALFPFGATRIILAFLRSSVGKCLFRWMPGGPFLARIFKKCLAHKKPNKSCDIPEEEIPEERIKKDLTSLRKTHPFRNVILGHFHGNPRNPYYRLELPDGGVCTILPAWFKEGKAARYSQEGDKLQIDNWRSLLKQ